MSQNTTKRNKKEEQKKLIVRIVCMVLVAALLVTSLLTMFPGLFQQNNDDQYLQAMIDAGFVYLAEDGNYYYTDAYIEALTAAEAEHDHENEQE